MLKEVGFKVVFNTVGGNIERTLTKK